MSRYTRGIGHYYNEVEQYRMGIYKGKIEWAVTLTYRTGDREFTVYTEEKDFKHMLRLEDILKVLFEEAIVEKYNFGEFCDYLGVKRKRRYRGVYEERLKNTGNLYSLLGEDFDDIKEEVIKRWGGFEGGL